MSTSLFQKIIDKLRGKPVRFYAIDKKIKVSKTADIDNNTVLGDYTYVGNHTTITRTVIGRYCSIGNNVTIGAGSVVVKDIPDNCIAVGNPCKPIKFLDNAQ